MYLVIMAGGSGTRLWPMSRRQSPKQFQKLVSDRSLIQETYDRLRPLAPPEQIYVCALERYREQLRAQLPEIPEENYLLEPVARNTGPAIGLVAAHFAKTEPQAVVATVAADHVVTRPEAFVRALRAGGEAISRHPDCLMTIGLTPTRPDTGLGYIRKGPLFATFAGEPVFQVRQFVEKPDLATAQAYLASGEYLWNASYFVWQARTMLRLFERFLPEIYQRLQRIQAALGTAEAAAVLDREYQGMESIAVDYGIFERAERVLVIPADLGWSDVGSWASLHDVLCGGAQRDVVVRGQHIGRDDQGCLIYGQDKLIATVGLENVVVVETPDVILVCKKERAQEVKDLVDRLKEEGGERYL